jgi:hypothetical protein
MCNPVTTACPDALLARGVHAGYQWEITNNGFGYRCGYVRVPPGHPWHGMNYDDVGASVHGGLTFSEHDADCGRGGADADWWLGFDCAHYLDAQDPSLPWLYGETPFTVPSFDDYPVTIRTTGYVLDQCQSLADQAADAIMKAQETPLTRRCAALSATLRTEREQE